MGWFSRKRKTEQQPVTDRARNDAVIDHLADFISTRRGVEAWLEEPTSFNKPSILLVAADGESTRRAVPSISFGYELADSFDIPAYDAGVVPYPRRMREYGARLRKKPYDAS